MNSIVTLRRVTLGVVLLCSGLAAASTLADAANGRAVTTRIFVDYRDLNMSRPESAEILYRRITVAARRVCNESARYNLTQMRHFTRCYQTAVTNAVDQVDEKALTALHRSKIQRSAAS